MAQKHVDGIIEFLKSDFWNDFVDNHLQHPDEEVYHAHIYGDTCIHPESLKQVLSYYFDGIGHPLSRRIDPVSPHPGQVGLHTVYPRGYAHFDMFNRFNADVVLGPMPPEAPEAEHGHNALSWGKKYQDWYLGQKKYQFLTVGPREEAEIKEFFLGKQWKEMRSYVHEQSAVYPHVHMNVEISFDPKILEIYAREALAKMGWTVERIVPCVYDVHGEYRGKLVFVLGNPEEVFDIAWLYNPNVVICRAQEGWIYDLPGFDLFSKENYNNVLNAGGFYTLTDDELKQIAAFCKTLEKKK